VRRSATPVTRRVERTGANGSERPPRPYKQEVACSSHAPPIVPTMRVAVVATARRTPRQSAPSQIPSPKGVARGLVRRQLRGRWRSGQTVRCRAAQHGRGRWARQVHAERRDEQTQRGGAVAGGARAGRQRRGRGPGRRDRGRRAQRVRRLTRRACRCRFHLFVVGR
jgi:hypothetical protein